MLIQYSDSTKFSILAPQKESSAGLVPAGHSSIVKEQNAFDTETDLKRKIKHSSAVFFQDFNSHKYGNSPLSGEKIGG